MSSIGIAGMVGRIRKLEQENKELRQKVLEYKDKEALVMEEIFMTGILRRQQKWRKKGV